MSDNIIQTDKNASLFVDLADRDYLAARLLFGCGNSLYNLAAYHAQQCLEKYLKAFLVQESNSFIKTHDLDKLRALAEIHNSYFSESEVKKALTEFNKYDQVTRYSAEANYDPEYYKDSSIEMAGAWMFSFEHIKILDKLVYEIRRLIDFSQLKGRDNLKDILEEKKDNILTLTWKLPIPVKKILIIQNDHFK